MPTRALFALPALAVLAACATPQEQCIARVTKDQRIVAALIGETQANIQRGYAIEEKQTVSSRLEICSGFGSDDEDELVFCQVAVPTTERKPVAIDLDAEKRKLASLQAKQTEQKRQANAAVAQCRAQYPDS